MRLTAVLVSHPDHCADPFPAEASRPLPEQVPAGSAGYLSSAWQAGADAARAGAGRLVLTHLLPATEAALAAAAARGVFDGEVEIARGGVAADPGP